MATPPNLLNDDGSASMATMFMMSHHGFRRDLARFAQALARPNVGERAQELREEWQNFSATLHGHHLVEDTSMFPNMRAHNAELAACIDGLAADHAKIDPLLGQGVAAFAALPSTAAAVALVRELQTLLAAHLATEEAALVPLIRGAKAFPPLESDAEADTFAQGFAWSSHGIAPDVLQKVYALLPERLTSRLPAALSAFSARCERVWGSLAAGAARTPVPDPLSP
jgi:hemerythrin HHE cation binding domain-containing protein